MYFMSIKACSMAVKQNAITSGSLFPINPENQALFTVPITIQFINVAEQFMISNIGSQIPIESAA